MSTVNLSRNQSLIKLQISFNILAHSLFIQLTSFFRSVITLYAASQEVVQLPNLIRKLCKSWRAVNRVFAYMHGKSPRNCMPSISRSIRLEY